MTERLSGRELQSLVYQVLDLCLAAGDAICSHYHAPQSSEYESKGDDSPLTEADLASHRILKAGLEVLNPLLPVLSEESSEQELASRHSWQRFWMVDPLDGTKEFLARTGEFTINIALVEAHKPVLGIVYLPLSQVAYVGWAGTAAERYEYTGEGAWHAGALSSRRLQEGRPMVVLASRRHRGQKLLQLLDWIGANWGELERNDSGSALKFCQLVEGAGDFYPRFARCCEWDTAAGQAVLEAAGGRLLGLDGHPLRYNLSDNLYSPPFFAIADPDHPIWEDFFAWLPTRG